MAYVECKIWPFQGDDDRHQGSRYKAMKKGHVHYTVRALIDTSSTENFISKSLADKLGEKYGLKGYIGYLDLSFRYKGKDELLGQADENIYKVMKNSSKSAFGKADLVFGLPWLWLHEAKIDVRKDGIRIYDDFVPFCKHPSKPKISFDSDSETDSSEYSSSDETIKEIIKCYQPKRNNRHVLLSRAM